MKRADAVQTIKENWRQILPTMTRPAKRKVNGETSYICPLPGCRHGEHGDGITYDPTSQDKNSLHCFSCGFSGSIIDLYMKVNNITDFIQATDDLAALLGLEITDKQNNRKNEAPKRPQSDFINIKDKQADEYIKHAEKGNLSPTETNAESLQKNTDKTADYTAYYSKCVEILADSEAGQAGREYIINRGISLETAKLYCIGVDPAADPANAPGGKGTPIYPTERIIAPCSLEFYIARATDPKAAYKAPNPKGSRADIFNAAALDQNIVFITEGIFDALSFIEAGQAAIALNGKGNAKLLIKHLEEKPAAARFVITPDNESDAEQDKRTKQQAGELKEQLTNMGYNAIIYNIAGEYHDANDAFIKDPAGFTERINEAITEVNKIHDDLAAFLDKIQTEVYKPHKTGIGFLDQLLSGGVKNQTLNLLAAAPAAGKTTLMQQMAESIAKNNRPVIYLNFEMSREQMLSKALSARLLKHKGYKITSSQILQGYNWTEEQRQAVEAEIEQYRQESRPVYLDAKSITPEINNIMEYLNAAAEKAIAAGQQPPGVFVDYLHLISGGPADSLQENIKKICIDLKGYAVKYDTFVFAILAINRDSMKDGRITLYSGRDSSNIEYSADTFITLNYADIDNGNIKITDLDAIENLERQERRTMILRELKHRGEGRAAAQTVIFNAAYNTFYGTDNTTTPQGFTQINYQDMTWI